MLWFGVVSGFNLRAPIIDKRANRNVIIVVDRFKVHSIFQPVMIANTHNNSLCVGLNDSLMTF
jgi:hypothetical protein